jgi:bifunctional non-homologous end joining protein LigD
MQAMAKRPLADYQAKRDFSKTAEPSGKAKVRKAEYPRFVIQKHAARRLHYDLRLEHDGVFKSWAVTKGPSVDPADKRLAVEVEDHPLDYGDFEGTIPEGEYGGGIVMLWDRGFWAPEGETNVDTALRKGELKFNLAGEKLKGGWVLVRLRHDRERGKRNNWLLIKHRDGFERDGKGDAVLAEDKSVASKRTMSQIAAGKGRGPKPFMTGGGKARDPRAVWHSNREASHPSRARALRATAASSKASSKTETRWAPDPAASKAKAEPERRRASRAKSGTNANVVLGTTISNPDKVLWPAEAGVGAITKLELARYLEEVGSWMLEHLKGRPCSVIRAPDGIHAQKFFQRHAMKGLSPLVTLTKVEGDREAYIQIDSVEALIAMAQLASIEFHPWNCEPFAPAVPGRLVFDLDPAPDVNFDAVVTAAKELRQRLDRLGLIAFCKTTGGKGLHVVTPLQVTKRDGMSWEQAKGFAQAVCSEMVKDSPDSYVLNMAKKHRTGRIFLDYLRNDRMSTAVAPLSPRMRPGAPVSMPLGWSQVLKGLDPSRFTIVNAPALLRKSKPWKNYGDAGRPLADAIRRLVS